MPSFSIRPDDCVRLRHMLDAALEIQQYTSGSERKDLDNDRKLIHSLVRLLEIIGEAAAQISDDLRANAPNIPWMVVIGMRNRLIHAYFDVNLDVVWTTSTKDVPSLTRELKKLLGEG